jgi:hypothetical protein
MSSSREDWLGAAFGLFIVLPGFVSLLTGLGVLAWQSMYWLEHAVWPEVTVRDGLRWWFGRPVGSTGWLGVDTIIETSPLSGTLMLLPFAWGLVAMFVFERFDGKK